MIQIALKICTYLQKLFLVVHIFELAASLFNKAKIMAVVMLTEGSQKGADRLGIGIFQGARMCSNASLKKRVQNLSTSS